METLICIFVDPIYKLSLLLHNRTEFFEHRCQVIEDFFDALYRSLSILVNRFKLSLLSLPIPFRHVDGIILRVGQNLHPSSLGPSIKSLLSLLLPFDNLRMCF